MIGAVISSDKATLYELQTVYGSADLADLIEVLAIDAHNQRAMASHATREV